MKATVLLEKQHRLVESLFKKLEGGRAAPEPILEELANNLAAHMAIEQEIFYPTVKGVDRSLVELVNESYEEHALGEIALKRLLGSRLGTEQFKARVVAARDLVLHHVDQEEGELFAKVEKKMDKKALEALGARMKDRFDEVLGEGFERAVPKGVAKTSADVARERTNGKGTGRSVMANRAH